MANRTIVRRFDIAGTRQFYTCGNCHQRTLVDFTGNRATPYRVFISCFKCGKFIWEVKVVAEYAELSRTEVLSNDKAIEGTN